ncbi:SUF system Fe-S cluster assembly protein [Asticcacaulis sp. AND118]|uniref:SUF system Fe-S cluster assembly protein n=1 Tax=Asticcacaulis sp. AND118 TaxID=2840468 RepID=UPI001CFF75D7|nr:SUF system Fe-S cluster assembly protein [Asticcacaulis sp. AND118]UDF04793.1 SUF system Fe-S cluster assembly protein [Asticcacaulis sp. AND118]
MSKHEIISLSGEDETSETVSETARETGQPELFAPEETTAVEPLAQEELDRLTDELIASFKTVFDPEIPVDIYELGLIYRVDINDSREVVVDMTLTAPGCPVAGEMPGWVQNAVMGVRGVSECQVNLVFDPPWDSSKMSDEAKLQLNMF